MFFFTNNSSSRGLKNYFYNSTYQITFQSGNKACSHASIPYCTVSHICLLLMYVYILYIELCIHKFVCICYVYIGKRNLNLTCSFNQINTAGENIIVTTKIRNNYRAIQSFIFSIAPHLVIALPTLRQQMLSLLMSSLKFFSKFCRLVYGFFSVLLPIQLSLFQLLRQHCCRPFTLLKALAKSNGNLFAIAFKSEKERQLSLLLEREPSKRSKELIPKRLQRGLSVIILQGAIEKSPILLSQYWKNE